MNDLKIIDFDELKHGDLYRVLWRVGNMVLTGPRAELLADDTEDAARMVYSWRTDGSTGYSMAVGYARKPV